MPIMRKWDHQRIQRQQLKEARAFKTLNLQILGRTHKTNKNLQKLERFVLHFLFLYQKILASDRSMF